MMIFLTNLKQFDKIEILGKSDVMNKRKITLLILTLLIGCSVTLGVSYAAWQLTFKQENPNVVNTGCFKIVLD